MAKDAYRVVVTKIIEVRLDRGKFGDEFWEEFNETIDDIGGQDFDYLAEHIAWNYVQGDDDFVEGVGPLKEMDVKVSEIGSNVEIEDVSRGA